MCIYCIARGVVIFCVVNMTLTCEWMNEIDMLCFYLETEETGTCIRPYWRSGISSTRERNSVSFHSFRYAPLVKRRNFSHSWEKSQIFNRDSCKNLLFLLINKCSIQSFTGFHVHNSLLTRQLLFRKCTEMNMSLDTLYCDKFNDAFTSGRGTTCTYSSGVHSRF